MESSMAVFVWRRPACERLPTFRGVRFCWRVGLPRAWKIRREWYGGTLMLEALGVSCFIDLRNRLTFYARPAILLSLAHCFVVACACWDLLCCQLRVRALCALAGAACIRKFRCCFGTLSAGGHTASNAPDLFRPPKLSGAGPG